MTNEKRASEGFQSAAEVGTLSAKAGASRRGGRVCAALAAALCLALSSLASAIDVSQAEAKAIGRKIWQNECAGTVSGLTSWNSGENFASLGIGHFIWYPKGTRGPFEESFPDLVRFAAARNAKLPQVVVANRETGCPWSSRAEFLAASESPPMTELRHFLAATIDLQAEFLVQRLQQALPKLLAKASPDARATLQRQFERVATSPQGCYALIDYVNFKGEGVLDTERYRGQGWGLLQVLEGMTGTNDGPAAAQEFARSARTVLTRRVQNSPPERKESRWLAGWLQRVASYTHWSP